MPFYLRTTDDAQRILLDTKKAQLHFEEDIYDLTGATLDAYDFKWTVTSGFVGKDKAPCTIFRVEDTFTGLAIEMPLMPESAKAIGDAFRRNVKGSRRSKLRLDRQRKEE